MITRFLSMLMLFVASSLAANAGAQAQPAPQAAPQADASAEVRRLTGAHTRVVWSQDISDSANDVMAHKNQLALVGLDSDDGKGERAIVPGPIGAGRPLILADGGHVVFSDVPQNKIFIVNWDGSGLKEVTSGHALGAWHDWKTDKDWIYAFERLDTAENKDHAPIIRFPLDNPQAVEKVLKGLTASSHNFHITRDGTRAGGMFPWPESGVARIDTGELQKLGGGCWASMAPDDSGVLWTFDGPHRNAYMATQDASQKWVVNISGAPGVDGWEVYHPRWSNHARIMMITGPYKNGSDRNGNNIGGGGKEVEVYLGRFNSDLTAIEQWARVTHNDKADFCPDAWVEGGETTTVPKKYRMSARDAFADDGTETSGGIKKYTKWPGDQEGLVFLWENNGASNRIKTESGFVNCQMEARGLGRFGRYQQALLPNGALVARDADERLLQACRKSNRLTVEAFIKPFNVTQEGPARIVTFSTDPGHRNFTLGQNKDTLIFRLRTPQTGENGTPPEPVLCNIKPGEAVHVIVSYAPGWMVCYLNGELVKETADFKGDFSNWSAHHLLFGDEWGGERDWSGALEGVAIYNRIMTAGEAKQHYQLYSKRLAERKPAPRVEMQAKLIKRTKVPTAESIAPYRRALVACLYEVEKVTSGECKDKQVLVAHWAMLDAKPLKSLDGRIEGASVNLVLEPYSAHPELQGERLIDNCEAQNLALYMDAGPVAP